MSVRGFFSALFAADSPRSDWVNSSSTWMTRGWRTDAGVFVSEQMALNLPAVYACVGLISDTLAMLPVSVEVFNEASGSYTAVSDDPREIALNQRPNAYMTPFTMRQTAQAGTLLSGNGMCEIMRNSDGQAAELWPLPTGSVTPKVEEYGGRYRLVYEGTVAGRKFSKSAADVLHIRGLGCDGLLGLSPIALARQALGVGLAAEAFGAKLFANDLRSGGWVEGVTDTGEALANFREYVNAQGGLDNAHQVKLLGEGMKFTPGVIPPEDAQFLGTREFTIAEFARMYRVPLELLQAQGKTSSWGSGIEQLFLAFVQWTLRPWIKQWEQEMTLKLLTEQERSDGMVVRFSVKELLRGDSAARAAFYERMHGIGAMSVNEIRSEEGRNPIPDGDTFEAKPLPALPDDRTREDDRERKENPA